LIQQILQPAALQSFLQAQYMNPGLYASGTALFGSSMYHSFMASTAEYWFSFNQPFCASPFSNLLGLTDPSETPW
jgi:hypothetical protein